MHRRQIEDNCVEWAMAQNDSAPPDPHVVVVLKSGAQFNGRYVLGNQHGEGLLELETTSNHQVAENLRYGLLLIDLNEIAAFSIIPYGDPLYGARTNGKLDRA